MSVSIAEGQSHSYVTEFLLAWTGLFLLSPHSKRSTVFFVTLLVYILVRVQLSLCIIIIIIIINFLYVDLYRITKSMWIWK